MTTYSSADLPQRMFAKSLEQHIKAEEKALEVLDKLLSLGDYFVTLVARLILEDERHHHALMLRMAEALSSDDYWYKRAMDAVEAIPEEAARRAQREVEELLHAESSGATLLRTFATVYLKKEDVSARAVAKWIELDTKKHEALLQTLSDYLKESADAARAERTALESGAM